MAADVTTEIVIDRPCAQVAAFAADPGNAPRWYANISSVRWQTPPPLAVGSRLDFVARFPGRTLAYTYEVTAYEPDRKLVMRTAADTIIKCAGGRLPAKTIHPRRFQRQSD